MKIMKIIKTVLPFAIILLLVLIACDKKQTTEPEVGTANQTDYGKPKPLNAPTASDDAKWITFGLITDTHIDASNAGLPQYRDTERVKRSREVIDDINSVAVNKGCFAILHLGDMVDDNNTQNLVAYRQLYENDYPGYDGGSIAGAGDDNYDAYSRGFRIVKPVFPIPGNHDSPPFDDGDKNWDYSSWYIRYRIYNASIIKSYFSSGAYAWRQGMYYFIMLGKWGGSYGFESNSNEHIWYDKLDWLKNFLAENVGGSNLGVLIFQHYSFLADSYWWTDYMKELELNVLCRRESKDDPANPYNIIGIFSGHQHPHAMDNWKISAGQDKDGNDVHFDQYIMMSTVADGAYGFSIVSLQGNYKKMKIYTYNCSNNGLSTYEKPIYVGWPTPTPCPGIPTVDYAGKTYNTVQIGEQCWLKENLDVGTMIASNSRSDIQTNNGIIEKYCYDNDEANCDTYGGLYRWGEAMQYVTEQGAQGICPPGWHIPTDAEYTYLKKLADNNSNANALKAIGQGTGDGAGTDKSGFSALFAGYREEYPGDFISLGQNAGFHSSIQKDKDTSYLWSLYFMNTSFTRYYVYDNYCYSVRCIKDD